MPGSYRLLKSCCISCSGLDTQEKEDIHERVKRLGGAVSFSLTTAVTHVIMKNSLISNKYQASAKAGIPVVSLNFITECEWEAKQRAKFRRRSQLPDSSDFEDDADSNGVSAAVEEITERNRLPPFSGCRVCTTGFTLDIRDEIKHLVMHTVDAGDEAFAKYVPSSLPESSKSAKQRIGGGGSYHGVLTLDCTHLIASKPAGHKFSFAKQWGLHVVSLEWFMQSVTTGFRQEESKYAVGGIEESDQGANTHDIPGHTRGAVPTVRKLNSHSRNESACQSNKSQGAEPTPSAMSRRSVSAASSGLAIPETGASDIASVFTGQNVTMPSRAPSRNHTAAGSINTDSLDLPPGLTGSLVIDDEDIDDSGNCAKELAPAARTSASEGANDSGGSLPTPKRSSPPLSSPSSSAELIFDSCRVALSEASLSIARRKEWRSKIAHAGGIWIAEGALDRHTRYLAAHSTQGSRPSFCTHFVVDDSDELCGEDLAILRSIEMAVAPQQLLSHPDSSSHQSPSVLSLPQFERPLIIQCGWLRACWRTKKRVDETLYLIPWPEPASDTIPIASSRSHASASETEAAAYQKAQSRLLSRRSTTADGVANSLLPPQPRLGPASRALAAGASAAGSKRQRSSESMVGRALGSTGIANDEPDPFMDSVPPHGNRGVERGEQDGKFIKRKKPRMSLGHELRRQTASPGVLSGGSSGDGEIHGMAYRRMSAGAPGLDILSSGNAYPGQAADFASSPLQLELSTLTGKSFQFQRSLSTESNDVGTHQPQATGIPREAAGGIDVAGASGLPSGSSMFAGCKFTSLGFPPKGLGTLAKVVCDKGGSYIDLLSCLPAPLASQQGPRALKSEASLKAALSALACFVDGETVTEVFLVIQLQGLDELPWCESVVSQHPSMRIVTECWVELCVQDNVRYPDYGTAAARPELLPALSKGQHAVFRPVQAGRIEGAGKLSLSISGYEGTERDHIGKLAAALNIPYSERFSRKTTHLICHAPFKGPKYDRAVKWGIPVVESVWIYDMATTGSISDSTLPIAPDKNMEHTTMANDAEPGNDSRSAGQPALSVFGNKSSGSKAAHSPVAASTASVPGVASSKKHLTPSTGMRPMATPLTKFARQASFGTPGLTPIDISLERNLQQALGNNNKALSPKDDDMTQVTPTRGPQAAPAPAPAPAPAGSVDANKNSGGDTDDDGSVGHILDGVVVALTTRLYHRRNELTNLASRLGCRVLSRFNANQATHLIHQSPRERETLRDYRAALQKGISVVSPWWLYACRDSRMRVSEAEFPYTYHPERRLKLVSTSPARPLVAPQQTTDATKQARAGHEAEQVINAAESSVQLLSRSLEDAQIASGHAKGGELRTVHRMAEQPPPVPFVGASAIDSLFGKKVARTRRRYRQAVDETGTLASSTGGASAHKEQAVRTGSSGAIGEPAFGQANLNRPAATPSSGAPHYHQQSPPNEGILPVSLAGGSANKTTGQKTRTATGNTADPFQRSAMQTPEKWWLNVEPPASIGYGSGYPSNLYSQEFQFSGSGGMRSMSNAGLTGGSFGGSATNDLDGAPSTISRGAAGPTAAELIGEQGRPRSDKEAPATRGGEEARDLQAGLPFSSPLVAHRTTIIYGEDAEALSERDQLLERLNAK
ncbi:hypothetical protein GQ54DRAFT_206268 [Martensiomyces pterosporus]|nr:hypothetical protein GQ54DRAFT_206268 [Martensiomyces pterosporus]